jgi:hypothetical protein
VVLVVPADLGAPVDPNITIGLKAALDGLVDRAALNIRMAPTITMGPIIMKDREVLVAQGAQGAVVLHRSR